MGAFDYNPYVLPVISFVGGSTQELVFHTFSYNDKEPFDLTSCTAFFSMINYVNKSGSPIVVKQMTAETSTGNNVLKVTLEPSDTIDLVGKYIYQISIQDISGEIEIPGQGIMRIANNINKKFPYHSVSY